jgi:hypothetical protein
MKAILYIADSIQMLDSHKPILLGLYPDRVVIANLPLDLKDTEVFDPPIGFPASLLVTIIGISAGTHDIRPIFYNPDGELSAQTIPLLKAIVAEGQRSHNLNLRFDPFFIPKFGRFVIKLEIDGVVEDLEELSFEVLPSFAETNTADLKLAR